MGEKVAVTEVATKPFSGQKPGTSGLRKRVPEFQQPNYTENFIQCVLDGGLGDKKVGSVLVVGGDGRYLSPEVTNVIIKMAAANGLSRLIVGQNGFLSTPAVSCLIRKTSLNGGKPINGGIILTASHNPGGPKADFGIKFNCENGGPAPDHITNIMFELSTKISTYKICPGLNVDFTQTGHHEYEIEGFGKFTVDVIDSVKDYVEMVEGIFDFPKIKSFLSGSTTGKPFEILVDSMYGATGPYVSTIFADKLGVNPKNLLHTVPKPDFNGMHPDPNLTYAHHLVDALKRGEHDIGAAFDGDGDRNMILGRNGFFVTPSDSLAVIAANMKTIPYFQKHGIKGFARSMPTAGAVDRVGAATGQQVYEVPTGWKYFGNMMDAGKLSLCGEESFGTGSDHIREKDGIWALLAWLQILSELKTGVEEVVRSHWAKFGRNVFTRYDYENVEAGGANLMVTFLESQLLAFIGKELSANNATYKVAAADNFQYEDPVDKSVAKKQGIRIIFEDGSRIVLRLSGTGSAGATIRVYVDSFVPHTNSEKLNMPAQDLLKPLVLIALDLCKMEQFTGRAAPTVITLVDDLHAMSDNSAADGVSYTGYFGEATPAQASVTQHDDSQQYNPEEYAPLPVAPWSQSTYSPYGEETPNISGGGYYASYAPNDLDASTINASSNVGIYSSTSSTSWRPSGSGYDNYVEATPASSDPSWDTGAYSSGYVGTFGSSSETQSGPEMYDPERSALTYEQNYGDDTNYTASMCEPTGNPAEYVPEEYVPQEYVPEDQGQGTLVNVQNFSEATRFEEYDPEEYVPTALPVEPTSSPYVPASIDAVSQEFDEDEYDPARPSLDSTTYSRPAPRVAQKRSTTVRRESFFGEPSSKKRCSSPDPEFSVFNKSKLPVEIGDDELLNPVKRAQGIQKARAEMDAKKYGKAKVENSVAGVSGPNAILSLKKKDIDYMSRERRSQMANDCIKRVAQLNRDIERLERGGLALVDEPQHIPPKTKAPRIPQKVPTEKQRSVPKASVEKVRIASSSVPNDEGPKRIAKEPKPTTVCGVSSSTQLPDVVPSARTQTLSRIPSQSGVDKGRKLTSEQLEAAKRLMARPQTMGGRTVNTKQGVANAKEQMMKRMQQQKASGSTTEKPKSKAYQESVSHRTSLATSAANGKRVAHQSTVKTAVAGPLHVPNCQIPVAIRHKCLNTFLEECRKMVNSPAEALEMAQTEERTLCLRASTKSGYMSASVNVLKNLRSMVLKSNGQSSKGNSAPSNAISHASVLSGRHGSAISVGVKRSSREIDKSQKMSESEFYEILADTFLLTEQQFVDNSYPLWDEECQEPKVRFPVQEANKSGRGFVPNDDLDRMCSRCGKLYRLTARGGYTQADDCVYHYSRAYRSRQNGSFESRYNCCGENLSVKGCCVSECHVTETLRESELYNFVESPAPSGLNDPRSRKVYALDCEMVYTVWGPALARVSVVDIHDDLVLDLLVKPNDLIVDCNTRFSGLTIEQLETVSTTIQDAHERLFELINQETILVGHSLESDFKALRLIHPRVVDTAIVYPHRLGPPYKRALRTITSEVLSKIIQEEVSGHDSKEDASACMQLMLHKTKNL